MAVESRSSSYDDLVSNNNALLAVMRRKGLWQTYSGPRIRQTLQIGKQVAQWYSGYDQLLNPAIDLFNDAYLRSEDGRRADHPVDAGNLEQRRRQPADRRLRQRTWTAAERALEDTMDAACSATARRTAASSSPASPPRCRSSPTPASTAASIAPPPRSGAPRPMTSRPMAPATRHAGRPRPPSVRCSTRS